MSPLRITYTAPMACLGRSSSWRLGLRAIRRFTLTSVVLCVAFCKTLIISAPALASIAACPPAYAAAHPPALRIFGLPSKVAYGRKVTFGVGDATNSEASYDESGLTIQGASPKPIEHGTRLGVAEFYLTPKRPPINSEMVTIAYVEDLNGEKCQRTISQPVQFVNGRRPAISNAGHNGEVSLKVKTYGEGCALMAPGKLVMLVHGSDRSGKLTLSDVCDGRWSREVQGDGWSFSGNAPDLSFGGIHENATAAFVLDEPTMASFRHYSITVLFRGRPFWRLTFGERVTLAITKAFCYRRSQLHPFVPLERAPSAGCESPARVNQFFPF
jgi:hypothetical protein